jgi:hypothetical protein
MMKLCPWMLLMVLAACATPTTFLKNEKTGETVACGGGTAGSVAGGLIGYHIQKSNDKDCVNEYKSKGFTIQDVNL